MHNKIDIKFHNTHILGIMKGVVYIDYNPYTCRMIINVKTNDNYTYNVLECTDIKPDIGNNIKIKAMLNNEIYIDNHLIYYMADDRCLYLSFERNILEISITDNKDINIFYVIESDNYLLAEIAKLFYCNKKTVSFKG